MLFGDMHYPQDPEIFYPGELTRCGCECEHGPAHSGEGGANRGGKENKCVNVLTIDWELAMASEWEILDSFLVSHL